MILKYEPRKSDKQMHTVTHKPFKNFIWKIYTNQSNLKILTKLAKLKH